MTTITTFNKTKIGRNLEQYYNLFRVNAEFLKTQDKVFFNEIVNVLDDIIFNSADSVYFRSNLISEKAFSLYKNGYTTIGQLCKQHRYPRKLSTAYILNNVCDWSIKQFREEIKRLSVYDLTTSEENNEMTPFQKDGIFNWNNPLEPYDKLNMKMIEHEPLKGRRDDEHIGVEQFMNDITHLQSAPLV